MARSLNPMVIPPPNHPPPHTSLTLHKLTSAICRYNTSAFSPPSLQKKYSRFELQLQKNPTGVISMGSEKIHTFLPLPLLSFLRLLRTFHICQSLVCENSLYTVGVCVCFLAENKAPWVGSTELPCLLTRTVVQKIIVKVFS